MVNERNRDLTAFRYPDKPPHTDVFQWCNVYTFCLYFVYLKGVILQNFGLSKFKKPKTA